ncbi:hypothetical protein SAMN04487969_15513 [Paenibacillus algorifonticola]|uniref:Uncharacterized protein n=1 Tax=Paenibacillus algorifonticola TaxID=684063 RepID=A0A1I2J3Z2_9BACL|nr:hypothetical protein [Paenibacillus algorifonticola]SFF49405.1 hypothetical protein SAMN04487969_15513 [Paenibacillus algorifonticola]
MLRFIRIMLIGVIALALFPFSTYAAGTPYFGPQGQDDFLWYGDDEFPKSEEQGITLNVDETSLSFQSVIGEVTMSPSIVENREIVRFYVTANNRIVDYFDPAWDQTTNQYRSTYWLRIAMDDWNIGTRVYFKIVAVTSSSSFEIGDPFVGYVVAWSNQTPTYQLKPLPVSDSDTHGWLKKIFDLLEELLTAMNSKLAEINANVKKIYEITPQTQAKFDAAMANLQAKLPTEQMKNEMQNAQQVVQNSANRIENTPQKVKFGEIHWMGVVTTDALDFTDFMELIDKIRTIVKITLWCEFFYFVILILRPRLVA